MHKLSKIYLYFFLCTMLLFSNKVAFSQYQQSRIVGTDDDFRSVFVTAGYSAALGAAAGIALLPFLPSSPTNNWRYITGGASIGFIVGSVLGFYNVSQNPSMYRVPDTGLDDSLYPTQEPLAQYAPQDNALILGKRGNIKIGIPDIKILPNQLQISMLNMNF